MLFAFAEAFGRLFGLGFPGPVGLGFPAPVVEELEAPLSVSRGVPFGMGNMYIVTLGSVLSSFIFFSIGNFPAASGCSDPSIS